MLNLHNLKNLSKEGIISTLFFAMALFFLMNNTFSILTILGLVIAIIAIYFSLTGKYLYSAFFGIATAFSSFLAQFTTTFCPYCTLAATAFLVGGLLSLLFSKSENITINLSLLILSSVSIALLVINLPIHEQHPIVAESAIAVKSIENKPLLYFSPGCKSCGSALDEFVKFDPVGMYWQPVVVPAVSLAQGELILKEKGYAGKVESSFNSPTHFVPLLEINGQYYKGNEITAEKIRGEEDKSTAHY